MKNLNEKEIIIDFENLIKQADKFDENMTPYMFFIKERILSLTGNN